MAIDYREYARLYGGGGANQAAGEVGAAIGRGFQSIPNVRDRLAIGEEEALDSAIRPLISLMGKNVDDWEDIGNIPTAFEAFTNWNNNLDNTSYDLISILIFLIRSKISRKDLRYSLSS